MERTQTKPAEKRLEVVVVVVAPNPLISRFALARSRKRLINLEIIVDSIYSADCFSLCPLTNAAKSV